MLVTIIRDDSDAVATTEVSGEMTVADLKSVVASDLALAAEQIALFYLGRELADAQTIGAASIEDNAMLTASRKRPQPAPVRSPQAQQQRQQVRPNRPPAGGAGGGFDASGIEEMRQQALSQPLVREQMRSTWPELADAVEDRQRFSDIFTRAWQERQQERERMERELEFMDANPTAENQAKILEQIRMQQVEENRQAAIENLPMAFGQVTMLYIPAKVGNVEIKAFVDSGAQTTIMSPDCAKRCGIEHLIDKRYSGIARGVGSAKIVGRVHIANLIVGGQYLPCSFTVIEDQSLEFLLGLDMLKRHSASIDLAKNVLRIPATEAGQTDVEVPFLPESEIPKREFEPPEPAGEQSGSTVGPGAGVAQSGAAAGPSSRPEASSQPAAQQPSAPAAPRPGAAAKDQIKQLVEMFGCTEQEAINALRTASGNVDVAASILSGFM